MRLNGWLAVKKLKFSYHNSDTILFTIYPYCGKLNQVPEQQPRNGAAGCRLPLADGWYTRLPPEPAVQSRSYGPRVRAPNSESLHTHYDTVISQLQKRSPYQHSPTTKISHTPPNRYKKALDRGTLGGLGSSEPFKEDMGPLLGAIKGISLDPAHGGHERYAWLHVSRQMVGGYTCMTVDT